MLSLVLGWTYSAIFYCIETSSSVVGFVLARAQVPSSILLGRSHLEVLRSRDTHYRLADFGENKLMVELLCDIDCLNHLRYSCGYSTFSKLTGRRSNVKNLIRKKENQKASYRQCSHLKESCTCVLLAN